MRMIIALLTFVALAALVPANAQQGFTGRWNLTGTGEDANRVYWLEVTDQGGQLKGMFLNRSGSPIALASVKVDSGTLVFQLPPGRDNKPGLEFRAKLQGDKLIGSHVQGDRTINWVGVRPPKWPASNANAKHTYGKPVELFNGTSLRRLRPAVRRQDHELVDRGRRPRERAAVEQPRLEAEVQGLPDPGGIQARRGEQQRHLPARPLRAAGAGRLRQAGREPRAHGHLRVDASAREREQADRRVADRSRRSSSATA